MYTHLSVGALPFDTSQYNCYQNEAPHFSLVSSDALLTSCNLFFHPYLNILILNNYSGPELTFHDSYTAPPFETYTKIRFLGDNTIHTSAPAAISSSANILGIQSYTLNLAKEYFDPSATLNIVSPTGSNIKNSSGDIFIGTSTNLNLSGSLETPDDHKIAISNFSRVKIDSKQNDYGISTGAFSLSREVPFDTSPIVDVSLEITHPLSGDAFRYNDFDFIDPNDYDIETATVNFNPFTFSFSHATHPESNAATFRLIRPIRGVAATFSEELFVGESFASAEARIKNSLAADKTTFTPCSFTYYDNLPLYGSLTAINSAYCQDPALDELAYLPGPYASIYDDRPFVSDTYDVDPAHTRLLDLTDPTSPIIDPTHSYALEVAFTPTRDSYGFIFANDELFPNALLNQKLFTFEDRYRSPDARLATYHYPLTTILANQDIKASATPTLNPPNLEPTLKPEPESELKPTVIIIPKTPNTGYN